MDYQVRTRKILKDCGAFRDGGHFVYSSGLHGDFYINKDALYTQPKKLDDICVMMADVATHSFGSAIDTVLAPAMGGLILGQNIAYNLAMQEQTDIRFAYAERSIENPYTRVIRRGYQGVISKKKVLLVDDVVTTGKTLIGMAQAVNILGGIVVGAVVICDRGNVRNIKYPICDSIGTAELNIAALAELDLKTFEPSKCLFCKAGRPFDTECGDINAKH